MATAPFNPCDDAGLLSSCGLAESRAFVAHFQAADPAVGAVDAIHDAAACATEEQTVNTSITNPDFPRTITATAGGTAGDIKAVQVTINGTDATGAVITEDLPTFVENTAATKTGAKAFSSITSYVVPAMDGTGCTVSIGTGAALGLRHCLDRNTVLCTFLDGALEGTAPTVTTSATVVCSNKITLNSALDGNQVDCYYLVCGDD